MTIGLGSEDVAFLRDIGIFSSTGEGVRFAVKLMRLYSIAAIKAMNQKECFKSETRLS